MDVVAAAWWVVTISASAGIIANLWLMKYLLEERRELKAELGL